MELLAPAGNLSSAYAAFKGGADAIYLGGKSFSARASAENFSNDEIKEITLFAHSIGKKVYVTLNTLLFQDEFFLAVDFAKFLYSIDVDGIIIQDLGLAHYLHTILPDLPLNASTQLNCHNIQQAKALIKIGFKRIVLARETNLEFAKQVKQLGVEVEVFGHGALCVSYSGNCLMSSFIGDRSGNRGRCAQPCRMEYELIENNYTYIDKKYFLSTKDLMSINNIEELISSGIDSLKLEGRLKSEEYIYSVARAYRHAIDKVNKKIVEDDVNRLDRIFSRSFSKGYLFNESPFKLLNPDSSSHKGEVIGHVVNTYKNRIAIKLNKPLHRLDGIRFNTKEQFGLLVENIFINRNPAEEGKPGNIVEISGIDNPFRYSNAEVLKTKDYLLNKQIEDEIRSTIKVSVSGKIVAKIGQPISLKICFNNNEVLVTGSEPESATGEGTTKERILLQLNKSGDYPYIISDLNFDYEKCFIPISEINNLRNAAFEKLRQSLTTQNIVAERDYYSNIKKSYFVNNNIILTNSKLEIINDDFMCFSFDNETNTRELRVSRKNVFASQNEFVNFVIEKNNKGSLIASEYCNITNSYALDCFYSLGFDHCILSSENDIDSIKALITDFENRHKFKPSVGIVSYGKLDLMLMKSCPIGTAFGNKSIHCNRCHNNKYELIDRVGARYRLIGDNDCNVRVLSDKSICLFNKLPVLRSLGVSSLLLFTCEQEEEIKTIIQAFKNEEPVMNSSLGHFNRRPL